MAADFGPDSVSNLAIRQVLAAIPPYISDEIEATDPLKLFAVAFIAAIERPTYSRTQCCFQRCQRPSYRGQAMHCETLRVRIAVALWLCLAVVPCSPSQGSATTTDKSPTPGAAQSKRAESGRKQGVKPKANKGQKNGERSRSNDNRSREQDRSPTERPSLDPAKDLEHTRERTNPRKPDAPITPRDPTNPTTTEPIP
jgi:hypothetical protein